MWERLSYFITAVAAILGWLITHYVDRVTQTPTIEYKISETSQGDRTTVSYLLTNVNRTQAYGPIHVGFLAAPGAPIVTKLRVRPVEPAHEGDEPPVHGAASAQYTIPKMMPGAGINFTLATAGKDRPRLYLSSSDPKESVRFTESSVDTWVATNETTIVIFLIALWALVLATLLLVVLFLRSPRPEGAHNTGEEKEHAQPA
jgi:hypothetical protein